MCRAKLCQHGVNQAADRYDRWPGFGFCLERDDTNRRRPRGPSDSSSAHIAIRGHSVPSGDRLFCLSHDCENPAEANRSMTRHARAREGAMIEALCSNSSAWPRRKSLDATVHWSSRETFSMYFSYSSREQRPPSRSARPRSLAASSPCTASTRFHPARGVLAPIRGMYSDRPIFP